MFVSCTFHYQVSNISTDGRSHWWWICCVLYQLCLNLTSISWLYTVIIFGRKLARMAMCGVVKHYLLLSCLCSLRRVCKSNHNQKLSSYLRSALYFSSLVSRDEPNQNLMQYVTVFFCCVLQFYLLDAQKFKQNMKIILILWSVYMPLLSLFILSTYEVHWLVNKLHN